MASHQLIDAYLGSVAPRLPADTVDELADGLTETYRRHRQAGLDADTAARSAVREFGAPDLVVAAFVRQSAGRRTARALMFTGPLVGLCWAATLAAGHAWRWPVPVPVRIATAATLLTVIAALALAATARTWRRTRIAALAGLGLVALDATLVAAVVALRPGFVWPMVLAVPASLARLAFTARFLLRARAS